MGHKRVKVAESQHPETSLHSIDLKFEIEDEIPQMGQTNTGKGGRHTWRNGFGINLCNIARRQTKAKEC